MPTIKNPEQKFMALRKALDGAPHPDGHKWRRGVSGLSEFLVWSEALRNGQERPTRRVENLQPEISRCKNATDKNDIADISGALIHLLVTAFDIEDQEGFLQCDAKDVSHYFNAPSLPIKGNEPVDLQLVALQPDYIWQPDNLSTDLSCNQGYDLQPSLEIDAMRFRIVGMDYAFVFKSLSAVISAPKGSAISFEKRAGLKSPVVASPYSLTGRGTAARAQFIIAPEKAGFIEGHAFFEDPLFTVMNAKEGDEITIETRIEQRDGALLAIEADEKLEPQREDFIERLLVKNAKEKAPKPAARMAPEPADQYITLVRQRLIVMRKDDSSSPKDGNK